MTLRAIVRWVLIALYGTDTPRKERLVWPEPVTPTYPYYTEPRTKSVRVRVAQEVLDFNLYLTPEDVWTSQNIGCVYPQPKGRA